MKHLLTFILILALHQSAFLQNDPNSIVAEFFSNYETKTPEEAIDGLYAHMPTAESIRDDIENVKTQFSQLKNLVGPYYGYDIIAKREVANSFVIMSYLVRYETQPVRFTFQFYKPNDTWNLHGFLYDDTLVEELKESMGLQKGN